MKKFLALLFVCAGLTAMAGVPQINKAALGTSVKGQKVMKANNLGTELGISKFQSKSGNDMIAPRQLTKALKTSLGENRLAKKAPRRLSNDDLVNIPYLDFRYCYMMTDTGLVEDPYHYRGSMGMQMTVEDGQLWCAGLYWNLNTGSCYYLPLNIDYTTGLVELPPIGLLDNDTISGKKTPTSTPTSYTDTVDFSYLVDGNFAFGLSDEISSVYGTMYPDGSIEFNDTLPYVFAGYRALITYTRSGNPFTGYTYTQTKADTTFFSEVYFTTQFIVPNASHQYGFKGSAATETTYTDNVYMYQADDTTVVAFNLWGFGYPARTMFIYGDGTMQFPGQYVYNSSDGRYFANTTFELDANDNFQFDDQGYVDGFVGYGNVGEVTPEAITWNSTVVMSDEGSLLYPLLHNVLSFSDGTQFVLGGGEEPLEGDINRDGKVDIADLSTLINAMMTENFDDSDEFSSDAADVNLDGEINISDVSALIDIMLTQD
jgi:hypothetical protein